MATIINKRTPEIIASRRPAGINFVTVIETGFYFPIQTAFWLGLEKGKYMHFINDGAYWAFYVNNDTDGFDVVPDKGYKVNNRTVAGLFLKSTKKKLKNRFYIIPTNSEHNGSKVYEIYTAEPVHVIIEKQKRIMAQRSYVLSL